MNIKLLKKGIKLDGEYYPCWYSNSKGNINGSATIYIKNSHKSIPQELRDCLEFRLINNTNIMADYFDTDKIRIPSNSKYFNMVEKLAI